MASARHSFKEQHVLFASALLLTLSIIAGLLVVERSENNRFLENQRQSVVEKASTIRARLEGLLNADLLLAQSLIIEVATNKDITKDRFFKIAQYFMEASHHIRNIGLAKGTC
jgi:sensor domain CHASE-containing protein